MHRTLGTAALWAAFMYMAALIRATPFPDNQLQQVLNTSSLNVLVSGCPFVEDGASEGSGSLILPERYNDPSSPLVTRTISYILVPTKDAVNGCVYHVKDDWPCPADRPVIAETIRNPGSIPLYQIKDEIEGLQKIKQLCTAGEMQFTSSLKKAFMVMHLIPGGSLRASNDWKKYVNKNGPENRDPNGDIPRQQCKDFMENFYKSVENLSRYYAFNFGIVHNDIKLPNIHVLPDYQYHGPTEDYSRPQGIDYVDWGRWLRVEQGNGPEADRVGREASATISRGSASVRDICGDALFML
ncbi:hypothetical protein B0H13DRAFT_651671 [Mycena leptocephala]|nr:hypothetical protein B0H13DRAFT_651671 [Mycena leptocephala]